MRKFIVVIIVLLNCFPFFSKADFKKQVKVDVPGMVCQMCVQGMKKNFSSLVNDPETDVIVDLDKKTVLVTLKIETTDEEIKKRVQDAGYNAENIFWMDGKSKSEKK